MHQRSWFNVAKKGGEAALPEWRTQGVGFPGGECSRVEAANGGMQQRHEKPAVRAAMCGRGPVPGAWVVLGK